MFISCLLWRMAPVISGWVRGVVDSIGFQPKAKCSNSAIPSFVRYHWLSCTLIMPAFFGSAHAAMDYIALSQAIQQLISNRIRRMERRLVSEIILSMRFMKIMPAVFGLALK